jgi:hypothetical protein
MAPSVIQRLDEKVLTVGSLTIAEMGYYVHSKLMMTISEVGRDHGIPVFDGIGVMPRDNSRYFIDEVHLNSQGSKFFAQALYHYVRTSLNQDTRAKRRSMGSKLF